MTALADAAAKAAEVSDCGEEELEAVAQLVLAQAHSDTPDPSAAAIAALQSLDERTARSRYARVARVMFLLAS